MPLSSNTMIHFTKQKKALKGILENCFKLKYCKETVQWLDTKKTTLYAPMVSFCDIPLSQIKNHIDSYGHYGIGLSREWAIKNQLNPVLYVQSNSNIATSIRGLVDDFSSAETVGPGGHRKKFLDVLRYVKNYEGDLVRVGKPTIKDYRFSDEREWRYVPVHSSKCKIIYTKKSWEDDGEAEAAESVKDMRLEFTPDDVKYIIIKSEDEIGEFINHLRNVRGNQYPQAELERLATRLLTTHQIKQDI